MHAHIAAPREPQMRNERSWNVQPPLGSRGGRSWCGLLHPGSTCRVAARVRPHCFCLHPHPRTLRCWRCRRRGLLGSTATNLLAPFQGMGYDVMTMASARSRALASHGLVSLLNRALFAAVEGFQNAPRTDGHRTAVGCIRRHAWRMRPSMGMVMWPLPTAGNHKIGAVPGSWRQLPEKSPR